MYVHEFGFRKVPSQDFTGDGLSKDTPARAYAARLNVEISWKGINLSTCLLNVHRFRGGGGGSQECERFPFRNISIIQPDVLPLTQGEFVKLCNVYIGKRKGV